MQVLVVGSVAYDTIETPQQKVERILGGSAIHFSAASSLFVPTRIVAVVGEDFRWDDVALLRERGVDTGGISVERGKTFYWSGRYHKNMNVRDTLATELNVFERFSPKIPEGFRDSPYLFLANINPSLQLDVLKQVENPVFTALDTMNFWIEGSRSELVSVLKRVDAVIVNDSEAVEFTGESTIPAAAKAITAYGPRFVIIKKGEHGCLLYGDDGYGALPAYILESVVDPTGAGDSFAGGFIGYIARSERINAQTLRTAAAYGTCAASFCCEDFGTNRLTRCTIQQITERFEAYKQLIAL
jgi:sugar/nucleoside kinase (ribokinase family)